MRAQVLVYALLYLVVEMVGAQLAAVEWQYVTPLMVAAAVADALVVVSVLVAALVAADLTKHRWRPALHTWLHSRVRPRGGWRRADRHDGSGGEVIDVRSWRPEPRALPAGSPAAAPTATYASPTYAVTGTPGRAARPFPEDDGRLL